jgi:DNA-directed RNA polymerase specialized sigma24 family protein
MRQMANPSPLAGDHAMDADLVALVQQGDRGALDALIERHRPWIYNVAMRMVYLPQDADDAVSRIASQLATSRRSI